jgi:hypothetical protein
MHESPQYPIEIGTVPNAQQDENDKDIEIDAVAAEAPPVVEQVIAEY